MYVYVCVCVFCIYICRAYRLTNGPTSVVAGVSVRVLFCESIANSRLCDQ